MNNKEPSLRNTVLSAVAVIAGLVIMVIVAAIVYLPDRADTVARPGMTPAERRELLQKKTSREEEELGHYGWIDEEAGRLRLPIDLAMDLAVSEIDREESIIVREFEEPEEEEEDDGQDESDEDAEEEPDNNELEG